MIDLPQKAKHNNKYSPLLCCNAEMPGGIHPAPSLHSFIQVNSKAKLLYKVLGYDMHVKKYR